MIYNYRNIAANNRS